MTQNEKLIALAELEGWTIELDDEHFWRACCPDGTFTANLWLSQEAAKQDIPRYLTSHDALQPLLEKMTDEEWLRFGNLILGQTGFHNRWFHPKPILLMTPEQKADAILKTYGKWKE